MLSPRRRTTDASLSATKLSLSLECGGRERLSLAKEWCSSLNSVREASVRPFSNEASIIDSIARPADEED
eukprot:6095182-Pleurochrysis_carterae.AAC.1